MPKDDSSKKSDKNPVGRPLAVFDPNIFERCCALWARQVEIAGMMKMSADCLQRKVIEYYGMSYGEAYDMFAASASISLRQKQREAALTRGSERMMIHLGEHVLGQVPKREMFGEIKPIVLKYNLEDDDEAKPDPAQE